MADATTRPKSGAGARRPPSRLQSRAPASLQISPVTDWNIAIPLLSPLVSPTSPKAVADRTVEIKSREEQRHHHHHHHHHHQNEEAEKQVVFKKWQHPAAPFCYEPTTTKLVRPFVPFRV